MATTIPSRFAMRALPPKGTLPFQACNNLDGRDLIEARLSRRRHRGGDRECRITTMPPGSLVDLASSALRAHRPATRLVWDTGAQHIATTFPGRQRNYWKSALSSRVTIFMIVREERPHPDGIASRYQNGWAGGQHVIGRVRLFSSIDGDQSTKRHLPKFGCFQLRYPSYWRRHEESVTNNGNGG